MHARPASAWVGGQTGLPRVAAKHAVIEGTAALAIRRVNGSMPVRPSYSTSTLPLLMIATTELEGPPSGTDPSQW